MALPQQVQAQLDAADAALADAYQQPTNDLAILAAQSANEPVQQAQPLPAVEQVATVVEPQPTPQLDPFETKYKVLQGKYNAEVPVLHRKVHALEGDLQAAIARLDEASKVKEQAPQATQPATDPRDVDNFGADLVDMVGRVAEAAVAKAARGFEAKATVLEQTIARLHEQMQGTNQQITLSAEQVFFDKMEKLAPSWEAINVDEQFIAWLQEVDPIYGLPRQAALANAREQLLAERAAAVFNAFTGTKPAPQPDPLASQITPKGAASVQPTYSVQPQITARQVDAFYADVRRGLYRGKETDQARIETMINAALAEGRITE